MAVTSWRLSHSIRHHRGGSVHSPHWTPTRGLPITTSLPCREWPGLMGNIDRYLMGHADVPAPLYPEQGDYSPCSNLLSVLTPRSAMEEMRLLRYARNDGASRARSLLRKSPSPLPSPPFGGRGDLGPDPRLQMGRGALSGLGLGRASPATGSGQALRQAQDRPCPYIDDTRARGSGWAKVHEVLLRPPPHRHPLPQCGGEGKVSGQGGFRALGMVPRPRLHALTEG